MKKLLLIALMTLVNFFAYAQSIEPAPENKAVIYFVRSSSLGFAINFTYFDGPKVIGRFNGPKFLRYECEPGEHLFWARSENRDYVQANLEAGEIYVIHVVPQMGGIKAGVRLVPINSPNYEMKKIQKLLTKGYSESFTEKELENLQLQMEDVTIRGLNKFEKSGEKAEMLKGLTFSPEELIYVKKKKSTQDDI